MNKMQNEANKIKRKIDLLSHRFEQFKKIQSLLEIGPEQIAKTQNLSQNELNQIMTMTNHKGIAKIRRIQNYEEISKEEIIISLLKSKSSLAEFFNNNLDNDKITDIKKILNRLKDVLRKKHSKGIKKELY